MRKPSVVAVAAVLAIALLPMVGARSVAGVTSSFSTGVTVGAGRTLPSGPWAFSDGCDTGIESGNEYRCAVEFDISSIPSGAKVTSAVLELRRSAGCATNDCPVDLAPYTGDGTDSVGDVLLGSTAVTFTPTSNNVRGFNVLGYVVAHVEAGNDWAGFRLSRSSTSTRNPDGQSFDISSSEKFHLNVEYVAQPVDVQIYLAGTGEGSNGQVTSDPPGIDCGSTCLATFEYASPLTLTAEPLSGGNFDHWEGASAELCSGQGATCSFIVPALNVELVAVFTGIGPPISQPPITPGPTPPNLTPPPSAGKTATPSSAPGVTTAPITAAPSAGPSASDGAAATAAPIDSGGAPGSLAPGASPAPTSPPIAPTTDSGGPPILLLLLVVGAVLAVAGGGWYFAKRRRVDALPPGP